MEPRPRASPEQFAAMIEFMERHGDIARPQKGPQGRVKADRLWQELWQLLNSIGGVKRPTEKWKKVWADWKTKTKKKMYLAKRETPGDGPSIKQNLSALELRVLRVMGLSAVVGLSKRDFNDPLSEELTQLDHPELNARVSSPELSLKLSPTPSEATGVLEDSNASSHIAQSPPANAPVPSPVGSVSTRSRRRVVRARRLKPYTEVSAEFLAIEQRRLQLEETRERNLHDRERHKLLLETRRIEMEENRNTIFRSISDNFHSLTDTIGRLVTSSSQASFDILSSNP